jgi:serine/threonine protein kinase
MHPERWRQIESLFTQALRRDEGKRAAFLAQACGDDVELRRELDEMLAEHASPDAVLDEPAWKLGVQEQPAPPEQLGPYKLGPAIGAGGMGTVYSAEDTRLGRRVAIKIARAEYSERFRREGRAIAALNHMNICTVHDVGPNYIVMELLEGETLRQRIARGSLSRAEVLQYGRQLAAALAEAHARGIVHRDLKPGNVMLTVAGVKVMDFGLAKMSGNSGENLTQSSVVMGTPGYMAPEQVNGSGAGPATDLYALGLIVREMAKASGQTSRDLNRLVASLLQLEPERRPESAAGVRDALDRIATPYRPGWWTAVAAGLAIATLTGAGFVWNTRGNADLATLVPLRVTRLNALPGETGSPALSPDGSNVAFSWHDPDGPTEIYTMSVQDQKPVRVTNDGVTDTSAAWSPDGTQIAYYRMRVGREEGSLMVTPATGGEARAVRDVRVQIDLATQTPLLTWSPSGKEIVYASTDPDTGRGGLYVTSLDERKPARRLMVASENNLGYCRPAVSPDGKWLAYGLAYQRGRQKVFVRPLLADWNIGPETGVSPDAPVHSMLWAPDNKNLYYQQNTSVYRWHAGTEPRRMYELSVVVSVSMAWTPERRLRLVASRPDYPGLRLVALQPGGLATSGESTPLAPAFGGQAMVEFSPDGSRIAFLSRRTESQELWMVNTDGSQLTQLTHFNAPNAGFPRWSHDGLRIVFHSWVGTRPKLIIVDAAGAAHASRAITEDSMGFFAPSWSADEQYVYADRTVVNRIVRIPAAGGAPVDLFEGAASKVSPDGARIYYGKLGHPGLYSRSLAGDPAANPEEKLLDDYVTPGDDLTIFPDGLYYMSYSPEKPRMIRFYNFSRKSTTDILATRAFLERSFTRGLAVSPDRRKMVYSELTGWGGDFSMIDFQ